MSGVGNFLFGSSGQKPEAFRGYNWKNQGMTLNDLAYLELARMYPEYGEMISGQSGMQQQSAPQQTRDYLDPTTPQERRMYLADIEGRLGQAAALRAAESWKTQPQQAMRGQPNLVNEISNRGPMFAAPGSGPMDIPGGGGQGLVGGQAGGQYGQYSPPPPVNLPQLQAFQSPQYTPFQNINYQPQQIANTFDPNQAVTSTFQPQIEAALNTVRRFGREQDLGTTEDLNRRGLLQSGATTQALRENSMRREENIGNIAAQLASQEAQARLGAQQFGAGQNMQAQLANQSAGQFGAQFGAQQQQQRLAAETQQAADIFRSQGASNEQALQLANMALQRRAQELPFQQFGLQQQQFGLQKQGFENQIRRQPLEDLMRLYGLSTGATQGYDAQPGLAQYFVSGFGSGLGGK